MRMRGYPGWFYRLLLLVATILVVSGLLLIPTALEMRLEWEVPWRLQGDAQIGTAALHALMSFLMMVVVGALWSVHMRVGWRHRNNHRSGLMISGMMLLLLLSAVGIYYLADDALALDASLIHMVIGASLPFFLLYHIIRGRRIYQH